VVVMDGEAAEQLNGKQRRVPHEKSIAEAGDFRPSVGRFGKSFNIPAPRSDDLANRSTFPRPGRTIWQIVLHSRAPVGRFGKSFHIPCAPVGRFGKSSHISASLHICLIFFLYTTCLAPGRFWGGRRTRR